MQQFLDLGHIVPIQAACLVHALDDLIDIAAVNKNANESRSLELDISGFSPTEYRVCTVNGDITEAYNDVGHEGVTLSVGGWLPFTGLFELQPHS